MNAFPVQNSISNSQSNSYFLIYCNNYADQVRNSYQLCNNGTLRVVYANGMGISYHTEPHILAGSVSPTVGRRNITLPTDNGLNSIEWRLRKELTKGRVTVFGRKLRVSKYNAVSGFRQTFSINVDSYYICRGLCQQQQNSFMEIKQTVSFFRPMDATCSPLILTGTHGLRRFMMTTGSSH